MNSVTHLRSALKHLHEAGRVEEFLKQGRLTDQIHLNHDFEIFAHEHQEHLETGNDNGPWTTWLILGGRGAGKTRTGAEWVRGLARGDREYTDRAVGRIALIGETEHDL